MQRAQDYAQSYSWHQSHDQATVLLLVPYDIAEEDVTVIFDNTHLVAGVRGHPPIVKGRLYGRIDVPNSSWQLEPRAPHLSARERTTSTTSTTSTQSSFAFVSETEMSTGLAASTDFVSEFEDSLSSPALSSPVSLAAEDAFGFPLQNVSRRRPHFTTSHPVSPYHSGASLSRPSSISSLESLHTGMGRLLTIHVEKAESMIWPSLVVGPVPEVMSPSGSTVYPWSSSGGESNYNMDPTSLVLIGLDLFDIRSDTEAAFEYFVRAWHQAHVPSAIARLSSHYFPCNIVPAEILSDAENVKSPATPTIGSAPALSFETTPLANDSSESYIEQQSLRLTYYLQRLGGREALAQLYLEAGLLFLEGSAAGLLSSSYAGLSSLRTPTQLREVSSAAHAPSTNAAETWRRDQDVARRFFDRARQLRPELDVPLLPSSAPGSEHGSNATPPSAGVGGPEYQLQMPAIDLSASQELLDSQVRRRRKKENHSVPPSSVSAVEDRTVADEDNTWYLYLPGLVGAGTALLVVGFLSFTSWRKGQGS
ncbi:hypothetical protein BC835DRAFT_268931 [Cytidiella melzeri]|nr:hypothetical protein BC835DRAFT_268931 [Cytidiella melzeri]